MILAILAPWLRAIVTFVITAPLFLMIGQCDGRQKERAAQDAARAEANVQAVNRNQGAYDKAAAERVADATTVTKQEEGLIHAIEDTPDSAPDAVRVRLGCERLRAAGTDITTLPACR